MPAEPSAPAKPGSPPPAKLRHLVAGPLVFAVLLLIPLGGLAFETRGAMGLLVWMAWWWITRPVHLAVTGLLPLPVAAVFGLAPMDEVATSYAQDTILLLLGANILTSVWVRWGLDRRIGLASLLGVGTDVRRQILVWFLVSAALSGVLPNTIVAATMIPIVVAMLRSVGIEDLWNSRVGTALVIAVAWGTSTGGAASPLGGAPNLLTVGFIEELVTGQEFLFLTWVMRLAPITAVIVLVMFLFLRFAMRPEVDTLPGSKDYIRDELGALGPMKTEEKWGLALFVVAVALAFGRPLYAEFVPGLTPAFAFVAMAVASFVIRTREGPLITWAFAQANMYWGLFYLFAGGIALGRIPEWLGCRSGVRECADAIRRLGRLHGRARVFSSDDGAHTSHQQHGRHRHRRPRHHQYVPVARSESDPVRLYRHCDRKLWLHPSLVRRRTRCGGRLRSEFADDGRQGSLRFTSGTPDFGGVGLRFGQVVAGIRSGVGLYRSSVNR